MIDEKKLINEIEKSMNDNTHTDGKIRMNHITEHQHFIDMVNRQPKIGEWIACSERLPESDGTYIVAWVPLYDNESSHFYAMFDYECKDWIIDLSDYYKDSGIEILAWQPLPEPYRPEEL